MKQVFVTGGSGFIGRSLIRQLVAKEIQVKALARSDQAALLLQSLGAEPIHGKLNEGTLLKEAMTGCDVVFHLAGWHKLGSGDWREAEVINVGGSRTVLQAAIDANVSKIVYTSTIAVFGDTHGELPDESFVGPGHFSSHYDRTKWLAHYDVVMPMIRKGAPIVVVMPGLAYGPNDHSPIGNLMRRFIQNKLPFPFLPGPDTIYTYAHVDDIAAGHILAAENGKQGELYILAGPPVSLGEMVDFWARLTGKVAPAFHIPSRLIKYVVPFVEWIEPYFEFPAIFSSEVINTLGTSQAGRSNKAEAELGWRQRPLRSGMLDTFAHISEEIADQPQPVMRDREVATLALAVAGGLFFGWLIIRRFRKSKAS